MRGVWVKVLAGVNPRCALECVLEIMVYSDVVRSYGSVSAECVHYGKKYKSSRHRPQHGLNGGHKSAKSPSTKPLGDERHGGSTKRTSRSSPPRGHSPLIDAFANGNRRKK